MQLNQVLGVWLFGAICTVAAGGVAAQSLSPMHGKGTTPSETKGFRLLVGNPYKTAMIFVIIPMDQTFQTVAPHAVVRPSEVKLAPGFSRSVLVAFDIDPVQKERTIGVCVQPREVDGPILPRVCGTYTGVLLGSGGL